MKRTPMKRSGTTQLKRTPLKKISKQRAQRERVKHQTYKEIDEKWNGQCTGCGLTSREAGPIHHSHLIPESVRKDLSATKKNITFHCIECHEKWEVNAPSVVDMLDYRENLARLRELDTDYYVKFRDKHK